MHFKRVKNDIFAGWCSIYQWGREQQREERSRRGDQQTSTGKAPDLTVLVPSSTLPSGKGLFAYAYVLVTYIGSDYFGHFVFVSRVSFYAPGMEFRASSSYPVCMCICGKKTLILALTFEPFELKTSYLE